MQWFRRALSVRLPYGRSFPCCYKYWPAFFPSGRGWGLGSVGAVIAENTFHSCIIVTQESVFLFQLLVLFLQGGNFIIQFPDLLFGFLFDSIEMFHDFYKLVI